MISPWRWLVSVYSSHQLDKVHYCQTSLLLCDIGASIHYVHHSIWILTYSSFLIHYPGPMTWFPWDVYLTIFSMLLARVLPQRKAYLSNGICILRHRCNCGENNMHSTTSIISNSYTRRTVLNYYTLIPRSRYYFSILISLHIATFSNII